MRTLVLPAAVAVLALTTSAPLASRDRPISPASRDRAHRTDAERLDAALAGLTPGNAVSCITLRGSPASDRYGDTLVYSASRTLKYRNDTAGGCGGNGGDDILVTVTPSTQLCRGDIVRTIDRTSLFPSGSCSLGGFIPYERP